MPRLPITPPGNPRLSELQLHAAHTLDGHWVGAVIVAAGYVAGAVYVDQQEMRHG